MAPSLTVMVPVPRAKFLPPLLSQVPWPLLKVACHPVAVPRSTVFFTQPVQAASMATPGTVVQLPPSGAQCRS
jgi:hypothetical protein